VSAAVLTPIEENNGPLLPVRRTRRPSRYAAKPKDGPVAVERFTMDGVELVRVPLFGRGHGHSMTVEAADWDLGQSKGWPECWILGGGPDRLGYVVSSRKAVSHLAKQPRSRTQLVALGRLITEAVWREVVTYRNGNTLDLRRSNLCKLDRGAALQKRNDLREGRA
jgi:hypothetical protein